MSSDGAKTLRIPLDVFETAESKEEIEDWLMANDPAFLEKMRQARREDQGGAWKSLEALRKDLRTKS